MTPGRIHDALSTGSDLNDENHPSKFVLRTHLPTLTHLMAFIRTLPKYLDEKKVRFASATLDATLESRLKSFDPIGDPTHRILDPFFPLSTNGILHTFIF